MTRVEDVYLYAFYIRVKVFYSIDIEDLLLGLKILRENSYFN
ncbi:hypothetical protein [Wolbachia endosymbiont of Onchocerca volvulus]|nr:hypothetical protein [Wolbachia endosymbiont of Onchocerca volvulus]